jgi:hypothetical protein
MREVPVPSAQTCRHVIVLIAAWLVALQAFVAGLATAQSAAMLASFAATDVICHGGGSAADPDRSAPDTAKIEHLCCAYCTSASPSLPPPATPRLADVRSDEQPAVVASFIFVISPGAIRAGLSQAPPPNVA